MVAVKTFIIAEVGVNHNGDLEQAYKLIDAAVTAGADAVKFQTFKTEKLVCKDAKKASYQINNTEKEESQYDMLKKLELSYQDHLNLIEYCNQKDIEFISSPFDIESIQLLVKLKVGKVKVPSGEITNLPYLREIASSRLPIILSTGLSTLEEVQAALNVLFGNNVSRDDVWILHCSSEYPATISEVNLKAMSTLEESFNLKIGYSDHTKGIEVAVAAVALGAEIIEKHLTLSHDLSGPDHKASLVPKSFKEMVGSIRNIESAMGDGIKKPGISELNNIHVIRKSIYSACPIKKGECFTENNLITKRPAGGISPMFWDAVIGEQASKDYCKDELISL